jgi:Skp family chaperone for outer membrane proteins
MKLFRLTVLSFIFTTVFTLSAFAQTSGKIAVINTGAFDDKAGITKYVNAMDSVDKEFATVTAQLQTLATRYENLRKEIQTLQDQAQKNPAVPINQNTVTAKVEEYEKLGREIKFKQEEAKANYERRRQAVMGPVLLDIGKAMDEFATQKGFALILDSSKLDQAGVLLSVNKTADVTEEFIKFYNARPAGTATSKPE